MYTYCRFWDAKKALLLSPGDPKGNMFRMFKTDDYSILNEDSLESIVHECKMGFVSVFDGRGEFNNLIGEKVLNLLNINLSTITN